MSRPRHHPTSAQRHGFGRWLGQQLARRDWTLSDFARLTGDPGVSPSVVSRWQRGERLPTAASCARIADALGLDVDLVLTRAGYRPPSAASPEDPRRADLIAKLRCLSLSDEDYVVLTVLLDAMQPSPSPA